MDRYFEKSDRVVLMANAGTKEGVLIPAGTLGTVTGYVITKDNSFHWEQWVYQVVMDGYENLTLSAAKPSIMPVPIDKKYYYLVDVLRGKILTDSLEHEWAYKTLAKVRRAFKKLTKDAGFYTIAVCEQSGSVKEWHCWMDWFSDYQDRNGSRLYFAVSESDNYPLPNHYGVGREVFRELSDQIAWLHNERAWKSGHSYAILECASEEVYCFVVPPPNTPKEGIIAYEAAAMADEMNRLSDDDEDKD